MLIRSSHLKNLVTIGHTIKLLTSKATAQDVLKITYYDHACVMRVGGGGQIAIIDKTLITSGSKKRKELVISYTW